MAELSIADFTGNPNATAGGAVAAPKPKAPRTMSVEEFAGPSANKKTENLKSNVAQGLDLIAGLPAFAMQVGETGMVDIIAALSGDESPLKAGREAVQQQWSGEAGQALSKPVQTMMGTKPEGTAMGDVNTVISQGIDDAAEHYQNKYGGQAGETVRQLANIAMLRGVEDMAKVGRAAVSAVSRSKTPRVAPEVKPAEAAPETPPPKPTHGTFFGVEDDAQINATKTAHDLLNRNASHKEVQAAIKRNPLVRTMLERIEKRREEIYTPSGKMKKGVEQGPMVDTLQGEVLGPEDARAATAAVHPEPFGYKQALEGMAQKRIEAAQTPKGITYQPSVTRSARREQPAPQPGGERPAGWDEKYPLKEWPESMRDVIEGGAEDDAFKRLDEENYKAAKDSLWKGGTGLALAGTAGYYALAQPDQRQEIAGALAGIGMIGMTKGHVADALKGPAGALGPELGKFGYTLKTLDRLPQNRTEFPVKMIQEQMKRPDVTKAEKDVLERILAKHEGETISANKLVGELKLATGAHTLMPHTTSQHARYGLENIERGESEVTKNPQLRSYTADATSTIWQLPFDISDANHFHDTRYFAHTRSFEENNITHVVEIQSDLAQHAKAPDDIKAAQIIHRVAQEHYEKMQEAVNVIRDMQSGGERSNYAVKSLLKLMPEATDDRERVEQMIAGGVNPVDLLVNETQQAGMRAQEARINFEAGRSAEKVSPMIKHWYRRVIREELGIDAAAGKSSVRFATADTVAKVEGWSGREQMQRRLDRLKEKIHTDKERLEKSDHPDTKSHIRQVIEMYTTRLNKANARMEEAKRKGYQFPEHQSIYDRYKKEIETYLKQKGGKPYTDHLGHTWIEVPTPKPGAPKELYGHADPKLLARIAALGIGVSAGMYLSDNKTEGAILGGIGALALTRMTSSGAVEFLKKMNAPDVRVRVNDIGDRREYTIEAAKITHANLNAKIKKLVPDAKRREAISHWREGDKSIKLTPDEMKAAKLADEFFNKMKTAGFDAGVLKSARENYVTHMWEWGLQGKSKIEAALSRKRVGESMSQKSPYAKERSIDTLKEGKELGLTPRTEDIGEIMEAYGNSMAQAIANAEFIKGVKAGKSLDGKPMMVAADKAPHTYVAINHPQLTGMRVHPDIAPSMEFMFDQHSSGIGSRALEAFNTALKRVAVSFSLFHNKALFDARMGAASNPFKAVGQLGKIVRGKDLYLEELKQQGVGPSIDLALKGGLKFSMDRGIGSEDVGGSFYGVLQDVQKMLDQTVPGMGLPVKGLIEINHAVDNLTWARMHTGLKLNTFMEKYEQIITNNAKAHERSPDKVKLISQTEAANIAASFTNDTFGGLNWRRVAEGAKREWTRNLALWALKPSNRRLAQLAMFAPDWTVSTVRALTQAFQSGSGVRGLREPRTLADLHRQYIMRSAMYYGLTGSALNLYFSGHNIWDNKDKTRIDLGDGRTMQWSKHTMEPVHWLTQPKQQALNKLGVIPRQIGEQLQGVEYLSASGKAPPMEEGSMKHLLHGISPISVQQNFDAGTSAGVAGFLGAPIYGRTPEQKQVESIEKRIRKLEEESQ